MVRGVGRDCGAEHDWLPRLLSFLGYLVVLVGRWSKRLPAAIEA